MKQIFIVGLANGEPHEVSGNWLKSFDLNYIHPVHGYDGGHLLVTSNPGEAEQFPDVVAARAKWMSVAPKPYDVRPDGKPNRPLTAFTVKIL